MLQKCHPSALTTINMNLRILTLFTLITKTGIEKNLVEMGDFICHIKWLIIEIQFVHAVSLFENKFRNGQLDTIHVRYDMIVAFKIYLWV